MELGLKGKTVLVTGGSQGIGYAIADEFLAEGASVIIASRTVKKLERAENALRAKYPGAELTSMTFDWRKLEQIQKSIAILLRKKTIDILIINGGGPAPGSPKDLALELWDEAYETMLKAPMVLLKMVYSGMKEKKWGRVLTISSTSAKQIIPGLPISGTLRAGLSAWTKDLARNLGRDGVLLNNLLPGPTNTDRLKELKEKSPDYYNNMEKESGLGRIADPSEIAKVAVFLCSQANTYLTGTDVLCDGGYTRAI